MPKLTRKIQVPITPTLYAKLCARADSEGRTPTGMARFIIRQYLKEHAPADAGSNEKGDA